MTMRITRRAPFVSLLAGLVALLLPAGPAHAMSDVEAVRHQIKTCWNRPVGAPHPEQLFVRIRVSYNPYGTLAGPPQLLDREAIDRSGNVFLQRAAESVVRVVLRCQPLRLPQNSHEFWRDIEMTFNPKDMLGG